MRSIHRTIAIRNPKKWALLRRAVALGCLTFFAPVQGFEVPLTVRRWSTGDDAVETANERQSTRSSEKAGRVEVDGDPPPKSGAGRPPPTPFQRDFLWAFIHVHSRLIRIVTTEDWSGICPAVSFESVGLPLPEVSMSLFTRSPQPLPLAGYSPFPATEPLLPTAISGFVAFEGRTRGNAVESLPEFRDAAALRPLLDGVPGFPTRDLGGKGNGHELINLDVLAGGKLLDLTGKAVGNLSGKRGHDRGWRTSLRNAAGWRISMLNLPAPSAQNGNPAGAELPPRPN